jgi:formate dehydrogenase major subunit
VFGAGGGTSSYREAEDADLLVLWGSNAREAHPIFFHHVLRGIRKGARLFAVDPRRTTSAQWADAWLGIDVGSDISLANAIAREIIHAGLVNEEFVRRATTGFDAYAASVEPYTLERAQADTGVPGELIRQLAHEYARADRAQICWTLGITEHHNAADNVFALINLSLLTGHVGRYGSGVVPLRGQNNVQGGGDMGAIPNKLTGFQDVETDMAARARFEAAYGVPLPQRRGMHLSQMFDAMEDGKLTACYIIGENPLRSEADTGRARKLLSGLEHFVVQDMFLTDTAKLAHVVLPATATWCEAEGTVTNSERRVQRVRKALEPPPGARDDIGIICEIARRLGTDWGQPTAEALWNELRTLSPMHGGMSYQRLEELGGIQWPCPDEEHPGTLFLHARLWEEDPVKRGAPAPFTPVEQEAPLDELSEDFPLRLTTGRRLDSYNTGVQSGAYATPMRRPESLNLSPEDAQRLGLAEGELARVSSRRGSLEAPVHVDETLRAGLAFMTLHFPEQVETNVLTLDAWDPKSGTAEFKATAIRVDKLDAEELAAATLAAQARNGGSANGGSPDGSEKQAKAVS